METPFQIITYCHIRDGQISTDGEVIFENVAPDFATFIKIAYKTLDVNYSKFFKMDNLSKLAFMGAEQLLKNELEKNVALVLSNKSSSLDTDRKHQTAIENLENFYPSPGVFVYTLPNICMGEISIKHSLYSENAFFIQNNFTPAILKEYTNSLLKNDCAKKVLCGWVDYDNGKYDAFLYIIGKNGTFAHTSEVLTQLYQNA